MKPIVTWVLIADGAHATVFRHDGPGKGLTAIKDMTFEAEHLQAKDIMTDKPGRSFSSVGSNRSAMEYATDPVQMHEARFVKSIADILARKRRAGAFDRLIIAAAPTALGDLRSALDDAVRQTIIAELPKDLINVPRHQLDKHFESLLAV